MFWGKKDDKKDDKEAAGTTTTTAPPPSTAPSIVKSAEPPSKPADQQGGDLLSLPKPSSVFEFGQTVQVGADFMRGVCTGDDPDAIQACTWSIEQAQGKPKEKKHQYRIEF